MSMSTIGIIATGIMIGIALVSVIYPLFISRDALGDAAREQRQRDELLTSYERTVLTLRDLDEDFRTGKLNRSDYEPEREQWAARGVDLLQQLEAVGVSLRPVRATDPQPTSIQRETEVATVDVQTDDEIEAAISRYLNNIKEQAHVS